MRAPASRDPVATWLPYRQPNPSAKVRFFCFPYAGGGAIVYRNWGARLGSDFEVCAMEPPGRGTRFGQPALLRAADYVDAALPILTRLADKPFVVFGHSMGALVAFELTMRLERAGIAPPSLLVLSGYGPRDKQRAPLHSMALPQLIDALRDYEGTPPEVLENVELMELLAPTLQADFQVVEKYTHGVSETPIRCPVLAMGGLDDEEVPRESLELWREKTTGAFELQMFPGNHFYFRESEAAFFTSLRAALDQRLR